MLSFFRTNQLLASSLLLIYGLVLHWGAFYVPDTWQPAGYGVFGDWTYRWIDPQSVGAHLLVVLLLFIQGTTLNVIDFSNKLSRDLTLFPGVFLILLASMAPAFLHLAPHHFANCFLLFSLAEVMNVYRKTRIADHLFNAGFYIGIASLWVPSYWVFIVFLFFGLNVLRSFSIRERLVVSSGFLVVLFLTGTVYFLFDRLPEFMAHQVRAAFVFLDIGALSFFSWFHLGILGLFLLTALFRYRQIMQKRIMQAQKKIDLFYWVLLFGGISVLVQPAASETHALVIVPALGILTGMQFASMERRTAELMHFFLFVVALFFQWRVLFFPVG